VRILKCVRDEEDELSLRARMLRTLVHEFANHRDSFVRMAGGRLPMSNPAADEHYAEKMTEE
jgi:hypothetical protein